VNQQFRSAFEKHLDFGSIFASCGDDAHAEACMFQNISGLIFVLWGIALRGRIASVQKHFVAGRSRLARLRASNCFNWLGWFIRVLRFTRIAVHAHRFVKDHRFDRVREDEFALAAPTVNGPGYTRLAEFSFH